MRRARPSATQSTSWGDRISSSLRAWSSSNSPGHRSRRPPSVSCRSAAPAVTDDRVSASTLPGIADPCYRVKAEPMDIVYLLDQLEEVLGAGSRLPLTSRTLVDEQEVLDILDQVRVSIPDELKAARKLTQEREQVIGDAHAEAQRILTDADAQVAERIAEHSVARLAEQRARILSS